MEQKQCGHCHQQKTLDAFGQKKNGDYNKTCRNCLKQGNCPHGKRPSQCRECGGSAYCEHNRIKSKCRNCWTTQPCKHCLSRPLCEECKGFTFCGSCRIEKRFVEFNQKRNGTYNTTCIKCLQLNVCPHGLRPTICHVCDGSRLCPHGRSKCKCRACGGASFCEHGRKRTECRDCGGGARCSHNRLRSKCRECNGSSFCVHGKRKSRCHKCNGGSICVHSIHKSDCRTCDPIGHLKGLVSSRIKRALKGNKTQHSIEYLGCDIETFKRHIEQQFIEGMSWENHGEQEGEWQIDHIIPVKWNNPTLEEVIPRLHYCNTQPLWVSDNIAKLNKIRPDDARKVLKIWEGLIPELKQQWITYKGPPIQLRLKQTDL